ncbi:MAG: single-stranded-DNA-specific exonuclease RecJ, partial [Lachnospiraceae bacterium]|nr:single-stranded-DNA-specific exonuclease RecJ [Lachnospiraceae bacterium]
EKISAVYFGDVERFKDFYSEKFGQAELEKAFTGKNNDIRMQIIYYPEINEYNGMQNVQLIIRNYR